MSETHEFEDLLWDNGGVSNAAFVKWQKRTARPNEDDTPTMRRVYAEIRPGSVSKSLITSVNKKSRKTRQRKKD